MNHQTQSTRSKPQTSNWAKLAFATAGLILLPGLSANAANIDSGCCTSGAECTQMIQNLQASCKSGNASLADTCKVLPGLVSYEWLLHNADLSPLDSDSKDFAGTYQLKLGNSFVMTNKWKKTDAPGITKDDQNDISLKKICYDSKEVTIKGKVNIFVSFDLEFKTDVQNIQGKTGYFAENSDNRFFFMPVKSDRTPITNF